MYIEREREHFPYRIGTVFTASCKQCFPAMSSGAEVAPLNFNIDGRILKR